MGLDAGVRAELSAAHLSSSHLSFAQLLYAVMLCSGRSGCSGRKLRQTRAVSSSSVDLTHLGLTAARLNSPLPSASPSPSVRHTGPIPSQPSPAHIISSSHPPPIKVSFSSSISSHPPPPHKRLNTHAHLDTAHVHVVDHRRPLLILPTLSAALPHPYIAQTNKQQPSIHPHARPSTQTSSTPLHTTSLPRNCLHHTRQRPAPIPRTQH